MKDIFRKIFNKPPNETRIVTPEEMKEVLADIPPENRVFLAPLDDVTVSISDLASNSGKNPAEIIEYISDKHNKIAQILQSQGDVSSLEAGLDKAKELIVLNPNATVTYTLDYITSSYLRIEHNK